MNFDGMARGRRLSGWLVGLLCTSVAGIAAGDPVRPIPDGPLNPSRIPRLQPERVDAGVQRPYIVVFTEAPLAGYRGASRRVNGRIDVGGAESKAYDAQLRAAQSHHLSAAAAAIGRNLAPTASLTTALNAVVVRLSGNEAAKL